MSKKHHGGPGPVPPGNRPKAGPTGPLPVDENPQSENDADPGAPFQEQDPQRRLGNYGTAGEHPRQQPGALNDGDTHSR